LQWRNPSLYSAQTFSRPNYSGATHVHIPRLCPVRRFARGGRFHGHDPAAGDDHGGVLVPPHPPAAAQIERASGLIGRVAKVVDDKELLVEVGENVKVRVLRQGVSDVRAKGEPAKAETK
jgi:hypothetical protein